MSTRQPQSMTELAAAAAALLPEPPADALNYLAWSELVWETAGRLAARTPEGTLAPPVEIDTEFGGSAVHLLSLAALFHTEAESSGDSGGPTPRATPHRL